MVSCVLSCCPTLQTTTNSDTCYAFAAALKSEPCVVPPTQPRNSLQVSPPPVGLSPYVLLCNLSPFSPLSCTSVLSWYIQQAYLCSSRRTPCWTFQVKYKELWNFQELLQSLSSSAFWSQCVPPDLWLSLTIYVLSSLSLSNMSCCVD